MTAPIAVRDAPAAPKARRTVPLVPSRTRTVSRPAWPGRGRGLVLQRPVAPGVKDQWLQLRTVYQRDDLTQHDQMIASAV